MQNTATVFPKTVVKSQLRETEETPFLLNSTLPKGYGVVNHGGHRSEIEGLLALKARCLLIMLPKFGDGAGGDQKGIFGTGAEQV